MKKLISILFACTICFISTQTAKAQDVECPVGKVCITEAAARSALVAQQTVVAQAAEIMTLREAVVKQKEITIDVKIEFAKAIGQITELQKNEVEHRAMIQFLLTNGRKKCGLFSVCIQ